ncbi:MAG: glycosyl transferase [Oscillospiraceae bacterium]|nr:glycosyl transferase [Oscillospiraceae bacterium]
MPDKPYLKLMYRSQMGKKLNLKNPISFNEKLQWLKLHDRNPLYSQLVDKYAVRKVVADAIGEEYLVPLVGGPWNSFDEIDFDTLPEQFVLKCTHDSGGVVICKDKALLDKAKAKAKLERSLNRNYYLSSREWPYKNVPRRIIAEAYLVDESGVELKDYKIFCFHGKAEYVEVDFNRHIEHKLNPYDFDWNPLNFCDASKNDYSANIPKPVRLEDMRRIAEKISAEHRFMRVDFYSIYDRVYIGELTLYPGSGFIQFEPRSMDLKYGELLRLQED